MLKRNLVANYLGQGWSALMSLAFIPVYIHYLGVESYGLIGLFAVWQAWLVLLDAGMTPTLSREMARFTGGSNDRNSIRDLLRSIEVVVFFAALLIVFGAWLSADWLANSWLRTNNLSVTEVSQVFVVMGGVTSLRFMEGIYKGSIVGLQKQVLLNVVVSGIATLRAVGAVGVLIWLSPTIIAFFIWQGITSMLSLALLASATYKSLPRVERRAKFSLNALRNIWRFASGMVAGTLTGLILSSTDKILLSKYLTLEEYGYYTLAAAVTGVLALAIGPVNQAFYPRFSELVSRKDEVRLNELFHIGSQFVSVFVGSISLILVFHSSGLLLLWTGNVSLSVESAQVVSLLSLAVLIGSPIWMLYLIQLANGWPALSVISNALVILVIVPLFYFFIPKYGASGAALIMCLSSGISLMLSIVLTFRRTMNDQFRLWLWRSVLLPVFAALFVNVIFFSLPLELEGNVPQLLFYLGLIGATVSISALAAADIRSAVLYRLRLRLG